MQHRVIEFTQLQQVGPCTVVVNCKAAFQITLMDHRIFYDDDVRSVNLGQHIDLTSPMVPQVKTGF